MDEADVLADHCVVISQGALVCFNSVWLLAFTRLRETEGCLSLSRLGSDTRPQSSFSHS